MKMKNTAIPKCNGLIKWSVFLAILILAGACKRSAISGEMTASVIPPEPDPKGYVCYRTASPIKPDGILDEPSWNAAPWSDYFVDIEGDAKPAPAYKTRVKMLWDNSNLYIAAELEEPHVWATLRQRDTVIFIDNDFEVFIDPDGDTQNYYELEVNAFGTEWDLLLTKPYRDDGGFPINGWDIKGLRTGTHVDGTINKPDDTDRGWSVEIVLPLAALRECAGIAGLPEPGDQWRINFSRVEWRAVIENGKYRKEINPETKRPFPEDNWVWSPQGRINMHMPEMWGYLQFSGLTAGAGTEDFIPDRDLGRKWALRMIYYAEKEYFKKYGKYTSCLKDLGLKISDFPENVPTPRIERTRTTFECYFPKGNEESNLVIYNDGRLTDLKRSSENR
ncbi:MAG TPA: carbohydrate-binding family 9-like protein [Bacteroidales bacterium]|nr:carbohydrate-binding family 9-like protein [Bacteroidales bacterium]HPM17705.1 carbohydrate-binding family 9-like protein [Bacteroidales bacterium]HQG77811.1 carbohydrate-binding family 9-like protein [Bacteroidales bacterium]